MQRRRFWLGLLVGPLLLASWHADAAGTPGACDFDLGDESRPADERAVAYHRAGIEHKANARRFAEQAAAAEEPQRSALLSQARDAYREAVRAQGKALKLHPNYYQAANEMGYALRQTGDHHKALGAYAFALSIKPDFYPALEYQGEALLALGRLAEARDAYMTLFRNDLALADELLRAMESWVAHNPSAAAQAQFDSWVSERRDLAELIGATGERPASDW